MSNSRGKSANDFPGPLKRIKLKVKKGLTLTNSCFESCTLLKWALATWPPHSKSELKWVIIIYRVVTFCLLFKCNMWKQGNGLLLDSLPDVEGGTVEVPSSADQARHPCQIWNLSKIVDLTCFFPALFKNGPTFCVEPSLVLLQINYLQFSTHLLQAEIEWCREIPKRKVIDSDLTR